MSSNLINLEKDTRLLELIEKFIQSNFKLANEIDSVIEQKRKREEQERKQKLYFKFKRTLIRAAIHFKRLDIKLIDFLNIKNPLHIQPYEHKESYELICAIKDKDIETICGMVRDNYFLVFDFDNVSNIYIYIIMLLFSFIKRHFIGLQREMYMKLYHSWRVKAQMYLHRMV
jgi:hypothetical protein